MKKLRTFAAIFLVLAMVLSLGVFSMADTETGSITVKNPVKDQTYNIYRIFDLETYNKTSKAYSYTVNPAWEDFITSKDIRGVYVTLDSNTAQNKTYVNWIQGADVNAFAKLAIKYAKSDEGLKVRAGIKATSTADISFDNLPLGYYLIDSSVGALCALTTNDPDAQVNEKNQETVVVKYVKDKIRDDYVKENSARVGDTVSFKSEITLGEGAENLRLHDKMDAHLSLDAASIKIYVQQEAVDAANYTVKVNTASSKPSGDDCSFDVIFDNDYIAGLHPGTVIRVEYNAVLAYDPSEPEAVKNDTWVGFGDGLTSETSSTKTKTYSFDLLKTNDKGEIIQTAQFYLYDSQSGGKVIPVIKVSENEKTGEYKYRVATPSDNVTGNGDVIKAGYAHIYGLDNQIYYLEEVEQPAGFNKLSERVKVDMSDGSIAAETAGLLKDGSVLGALATDAGGIQIINKSGTLLPGTGGAGTTLLYVLGGILVAVAAALLITRQRMNRDDENE